MAFQPPDGRDARDGIGDLGYLRRGALQCGARPMGVANSPVKRRWGASMM